MDIGAPARLGTLQPFAAVNNAGHAAPAPNLIDRLTTPFPNVSTLTDRARLVLQPPHLTQPRSAALAEVTRVDDQRLEVAKGTFNVTLGWAENETQQPVLRGHLTFTPRAGVTPANDAIAFVQIARVQLSHGEDYVWPSGESARNLIATRRDQASGIEPGFYIDHRQLTVEASPQKSPFFRDSWANSDESADGEVRGGKLTRPASMVDYPVGWDMLERINLEACAVSRTTGEIYGCVRWGGHWPLTGDRKVFAPQASDKPSPTFDRALAQFHAHYDANRIQSASK